jgi:hypothetical protein
MHKSTTAVLAARVVVLSLALQEIARALPPAQSAQVVGTVCQRVTALAHDVACG